MTDPVVEGSASMYVYSRLPARNSQELISSFVSLRSAPGTPGTFAKLVPAHPGDGLNSLDVPVDSA